MTGGWSKGCREYYAYYRCMRRGCAFRTKSAPRAKVEGAFAEILRSAQPAPDLIELAKAMLEDAWEMRISEAEGVKAELDKELIEVNGKIESLLDRIVEATNPLVISAYEARIERLEREKIVIAEGASKAPLSEGRLDDSVELALEFLSNPWKLYENGDFTTRRAVLKMAFSEPIRYAHNGAYRTPKFSFPFRYLAEDNGQENDMVRLRRLELPRELPHSDLNAARLPVPPQPHCAGF